MPIDYWSRSSDAKCWYDTTHKEVLAVVWSVLMLRPYLERSHSKVRADHQALRQIRDLKESTGCLAKWRLRLLKLDFEVVHRPGVYHHVANAISSFPEEIPIVENQGKDDIHTLDIQKIDKDNSPFLCAATHV